MVCVYRKNIPVFYVIKEFQFYKLLRAKSESCSPDNVSTFVVLYVYKI